MSTNYTELIESNIVAGSGGAYHTLIESENLVFLDDVLRDDSFDLKQAVDLCYIDPPYNTGNTEAQNFTYNDAFGGSDNWLQFMRARLAPLKEILKPTGVVVISIDDSEVHHLRVLCDEIFGARNFMAQLVIDGGNPKNNAKFFSITHEYMLVYAKNLSELNRSGIKWRKEREGIDLLLGEYENLKKAHKSNYAKITSDLKKWVKTAPLSKRLKVFYNADKNGLYTYADLSTPGNGARYDVLHPVTGKPSQVPSRGWGLSEEKMAQLIADDMILFGADETFQPLKKLYLQNRKDQVQKGILEYPSRSSTHLLEKLLGRRSSFNNPKNLQMMMDIIDLILPSKGVVLDYFAGSGTTGHAVVELNARDGGSRRFVMVTNNENEIFDTVTLPRVQQVLETIKTTDGLKVYRSVKFKEEV
jgi:adenine-specific DNA-methyltransferase